MCQEGLRIHLAYGIQQYGNVRKLINSDVVDIVIIIVYSEQD